MCLQTTWKEPKIAEEDIKVYKGFNLNIYNNLISPYNDFTWKSNKKYNTEINITDDDSALDQLAVDELFSIRDQGISYNSIGEGFHSALEKNRLDINDFDLIIECIIPKGAKYYEGLSKLAVSDSIMVTENVVNSRDIYEIDFKPKKDGSCHIDDRIIEPDFELEVDWND